MPAGDGFAARGTAELRALAVNRARPLDGDVLGVDGINQSDVSVSQRRIAGQRHGVHVVILFAIGGAEQSSARRDVQRHVAFQFNHADDKHARGHENRAALVMMTRINRRLHRRGVERLAVAFRAEIANIIDSDRCVAGQFGGGPSCGQQARAYGSGDGGGGSQSQPFATGKELPVRVSHIFRSLPKFVRRDIKRLFGYCLLQSHCTK